MKQMMKSTAKVSLSIDPSCSSHDELRSISNTDHSFEETSLSLKEKEGAITVVAVFGPSPSIAFSAQCPRQEFVGPILNEVNSICVHYASYSSMEALLDARSQKAFFEIPGPIEPIASTNIQLSCNMSCIAVMERIQNPPMNYPVLNSLKTGSYICNLLYFYPSGHMTCIPVYKANERSTFLVLKIIHNFFFFFLLNDSNT
jgi:hypothetical protein